MRSLMLTSKEQLLKEARALSYKPEILEKVYRLLDVLGQILAVPYLKDSLVLKGGTALNLYFYKTLPRLSVDIDLNYIGEPDREKMLKDKPIIIDTISKILIQNKFTQHRAPGNHAGGKMVWFYNSVLGQRSALEIDLNFMYRQTLYPITSRIPNIQGYSHCETPVLDIHELAAGKLSALFNRTASRDLFDAHYLLTQGNLNLGKLKQALVVYLAMSKVDLNALTPEAVKYNFTDLKNRLLPVLNQKSINRAPAQLKSWATTLTSELQQALTSILPLQENENEFIQKIRTEGKIQPELITDDKIFTEKVLSHPALHWAVKQWGH